MVTRLLPPTKTCRKCQKILLRSEFYSRPDRGPYGLRNQCKTCTKQQLAAIPKTPHAQLPPEKKARRKQIFRKSLLKRLYGMTPDDYTSRLAAQGGVCAVCKSSVVGGRHAQGTFIIDHCHTTGAVRGLVCNRCNLALGVIKDDPVLLLQLRAYLLAATASAT